MQQPNTSNGASTLIAPKRRLPHALGATFVTVALAMTGASPLAHADTTLLNVSYDVTRELYQEIDPAFTAYWKKTTGETVTIKQSHGGSSPQALSVLQGLPADVVTMNQSSDIDVLVQKGGLVDKIIGLYHVSLAIWEQMPV